MILQVDGVSFEAREPTDLSWLRPYGKVFHVFDRQDSGNLCFGVDGPYGRLFIKYAGARPVNYAGRPRDAVMTLRSAVSLYEQFRHPALTALKAHGAVNGGLGYAALFAWVDGACLRASPPDQDVLTRLHHLPLPTKLQMLDDVFDLHLRLAEEGYASVDFDDSNLLIDFQQGRCTVCDIDRYQKRPLVNRRGRMPGRSVFRAPEAFVQNAAIDESTMVFEMGMLAHEFLGDAYLSDMALWYGPELLRRVACTAIQPKQKDRYPSMRTFLHAWRMAVRDSWIY